MKMLGYTRNWLQFHAPNTGGPSGGGASGTPPEQAGQQQQVQSNTPPDPFAAIDTSEMDDVQLAAFNKAKEEFATLQKTATDREREARQHQSERDRVTAELHRVKQSVNGQQPNTPKTAEERVYAQLIADNVPEAAARVQAKTMAAILDNERNILTQQLQQQFAPVAALTLQNHAEGAFNAATATDHIGWSAIPEIKELVWQSAVQMSQQGQQVDITVIKNLAAMHYMAYTEQNPQVFATLQTGGNQPNNGMTNPAARPSVPFPNVNTGFSYPGANFQGRTPAVNNPNAPRYQMDAGTSAAMAAVNDQWVRMGLKPKA